MGGETYIGDKNSPNAKTFPVVKNKDQRFTVITASFPLNISHHDMEALTMYIYISI